MSAPPRRSLFVLLVAIAGISAISGYVRDAALARLFGAGSATDSYYAALRLPFVVSWFLVAGALVPVLTRRVAQLLEAGERERAAALLRRALSSIAVVYGGSSILAFTFRDEIVRFLAPGFDAETSAGTARLFAILLVYGIAVALANVAGAGLLAAGRYVAPALALLVGNLLSLGILFAGASRWGVTAAAAGQAIGLVVALVVTLAALPAAGLPLFGAVGTDRLPIRESAWVAGGLLAALGVELAEQRSSSIVGPGAVSILALAGKLVHLPMRLVAAPLASVAYPRLVRSRAAGAPTGEAAGTAAIVIGLLLLSSAITLAAAGPAVSVVFGRGRFDASAVADLSGVLRILAPAIVALGIVEIATKYLLASGGAKETAIVQAGGFVLYAAIAPLAIRGGLPALASLRSAAWVLPAAGLTLLLWRRDRSLHLFPPIGITFAATALAVGAGLLAARLVPGGRLASLSAAIVAATILFALPFLPSLRRVRG